MRVMSLDTKTDILILGPHEDVLSQVVLRCREIGARQAIIRGFVESSRMVVYPDPDGCHSNINFDSPALLLLDGVLSRELRLSMHMALSVEAKKEGEKTGPEARPAKAQSGRDLSGKTPVSACITTMGLVVVHHDPV